MPPATSPTRRVLGEKDANASLNISSPRKSQKTSLTSTPNARTQIQSKLLSGAINAVSQTPRVGQKRGINEVEGVEVRDWDEIVRVSQASDIISDSASDTENLNTSMLSARSAADTTMTSFGIGASQENPMEQQFEILEPPMSQRTLDKIHAVMLPQNTSQPSQFRERLNLTHDASLDSVGMSTFLNFHSDGSSQGSDGMRMIGMSQAQDEPKETGTDGQTVEKKLSEEDKRKIMMEEKAAQLRTRLQLALFKVETRQTNTPFARLRIPESHRRKSESSPSLPPPSANSYHKPSHSISAPVNQRNGSSPEARVAALRAQATMQHKPAAKSLSSLPMPNIRPTTFSARWADQEPSSHPDIHGHTHAHPDSRPPLRTDGSNDEPTIEIPSSPPFSSRTLHIHEDETATNTGNRARTNSSPSTNIEIPNSQGLPTPNSPAVRSNTSHDRHSLPPNQTRDGESIDDDRNRPASEGNGPQGRERRLTHSAVKGEAASGLLQLMRSGGIDAGNVRGPMCGF